MSGGIPLSELISVTSTGIRETFSLSKLPTLLITQSTELPAQRWSKFYDSASVGKAFGNQSTAKLYADNYFSFTSKKAQRADLLNILYYNTEAKPASLIGSRAKDLDKLKTLNGAFSISIGGVKKDISVDLTSAVSYSDIATKLQESLRLAGTPAPTELTITQAENTRLEINKGTDGQNQQTLTINAEADYSVTNSADNIATYNKETRIINAQAQGTTKLIFISQAEGKNKIRVIVDVQVTNESGLKITASVGAVTIMEQVFKVKTNAHDFTAELNNDNAEFNKDTKTLKGLKQGQSVLTFKAKYGEASETSKAYNITIGAQLGLTIAEAPKARKAELGGAENPILPAFTDASVIYSTQTSGFIISSGTKGADSSISAIESPSAETDISEQLGLSQANGARVINGLDSIPSFTALLDLIQAENGAYYVLQFDTDLSDDNQLEFAKFINNSSDRFLGIINTQDSAIISQENALQAYLSYNGVLIEYTKDKSPLGLSAGIISALNFKQNGGNTNIAFNSASAFKNIAITDKAQFKTLEANNANSILKFAQIGQSQVWYGMGNIQGTKTNNANVYIANSYLMFQLQFSLANMIDSQGLIGMRGNANESIILAYLQDVFTGGVNAGIIVGGAELNTTEKQTILSAFKKESAITAIERQGYYYTIDSIDLVNSTINISTAYIANKAVKKLVINNYILGA